MEDIIVSVKIHDIRLEIVHNYENDTIAPRISSSLEETYLNDPTDYTLENVAKLLHEIAKVVSNTAIMECAYKQPKLELIKG